MRTSVLVPKGVHYDLDDAGRPPSRWPWVLGAILLAGIVAGMTMTLHGRRAADAHVKRSASSQVPADASPDARPPDQWPRGSTNGLPRWPASVNAEVRHLIEGAEAAFRAGDLLSARRRYLEILGGGNLCEAAAFVEQRLGEIGMLLILTPRPMPEKTEYVVKRGELAERIARQYAVTRELLIKSNELRHPERLQTGQHLLILDKPAFTIVINRNVNALRLFLNGKFLKGYAIGTGRRDATPLGTYAIRNRQERPVWWRSDGRMIPYGRRENILGTRWMSLLATGATEAVKGYGIHGTWNEDEVGRSAASGGIRMRNADVEELCLIVPEGTPVRIVE